MLDVEMGKISQIAYADDPYSNWFRFNYQRLYAPSAGMYSLGWVFSGLDKTTEGYTNTGGAYKDANFSDGSNIASDAAVVSGGAMLPFDGQKNSDFSITFGMPNTSDKTWHYARVSMWVDFTPGNGISSIVDDSINIDSSSRMGDIIDSNFSYNSPEDNSVHYTDTSTHIVDESASTWYNPVTNTTNNYTDWSYDYSTRTYTLSMDDNSTTITYGDEYVTIQEGDTVYNLNYVTYVSNDDDNGGGSSGGNGGSSSNSDPTGQLSFTELTTFANNLFQKLLAPVQAVNGFMVEAFSFLPEEFVELIEFAVVLAITGGIVKNILF